MAMCESHDRAVVRTRRHCQRRSGRIVELHNERVVAPNAKWGWQRFEQPFAVMSDVRGLPVHGATGSRDQATENASNALVSKTDAEDRYAAGKLTNNGRGNPGLRRRARARRDHYRAWPEPNEIANAGHVVPNHLRRFPKLAEVASDIEDEGIIIVDDHNQDVLSVSALNASKMRCAFASVSSYSVLGSDIAVIPPPA